MAVPKNLTPSEFRLRQQLAVHSSWFKTEDRTARTQPGLQAANVTRFEDQVDPDRKLTPEERAKRVVNARQAHLKRIALASAKARRLKRQAAQEQKLAGGGGSVSA
jgi:hypothetical protein